MESQTVLITGGSRGIGAATVRLAARRGYQVCFSYRSQKQQADDLVTEVQSMGSQAIAVIYELVRAFPNVCSLSRAQRQTIVPRPTYSALVLLLLASGNVSLQAVL